MIGGVVGAVSSAATTMQSNAEGMSALAVETNRQSVTVAAASEQASANVITVAAAAEEQSQSVAEINRQIAESSRITEAAVGEAQRSEEHKSELQSLMRISYAVFCCEK